MHTNEWTYQCKKEIRTFKDLELEKQRIELYQQFLKQLLTQDKIDFKKALEPRNLLNSTLNNVFNKTTNNSNLLNSLGSSNLISSLVSWILKKIF